MMILCLLAFGSVVLSARSQEVKLEDAVQYEHSRYVELPVSPTKPVSVYFACPFRENVNDTEAYYRQLFDGSFEALKNDTVGATGVVIPIRDSTDLRTYYCEVRRAGTLKRTVVARLIITRARTANTFDQLVYEPKDVLIIRGTVGKPVNIKCPLDADKASSIIWFRPPQYRLVDIVGNLSFASLTQYDFGTYLCAVQDQTKQTSLKVSKIIILPDGAKSEMPIDEDAETIHQQSAVVGNILRYICPMLKDNRDQVIWERPPGTILLAHQRDFFIDPVETSIIGTPFYCRTTRHGDPLVNVAAKIYFSTSSTNEEIEFLIEGQVKTNELIHLDCKVQGKAEEEIIWMKDGEVVNKGQRLTIEKFNKEKYGSYTCEVHKKGKGRAAPSLKKKTIDLTPRQIRQSKVELTEPPGDVFYYYRHDQKELHCEIQRANNRFIMHGRDVTWSFNSKIIDTMERPFNDTSRFYRLDRPSVSILVLNNMDNSNDGEYRCYQNNYVLATNLIMYEDSVLMELEPKSQTYIHNTGAVAEFHCRLEGHGVNNSLINWKFIREGTTTEIDLLPNAKVENPIATESTSFVVVENVLKEDAGTYVCRVLNLRSAGVLNVLDARLTVNPEVVEVKPGGNANILCELDGVKTGKVTWHRVDRKDLQPEKEQVIGGETRAMLIVSKIQKSDHNTTYECAHGGLTKRSVIYVKDICGVEMRACTSAECINEKLFCDGKPDCKDGSDEQPEKCKSCEPNQVLCQEYKGAKSKLSCILKHWECDGEDDCGNNFDESNCTVKNAEKCLGTHYMCSNGSKLIARAYWCDGEPDCPGVADDEFGCSGVPQITYPPGDTTKVIMSGSTIVLTCNATGRPLPSIVWRFNWGHLPDGLAYNITTMQEDCSRVVSKLTLNNADPRFSGVYTCEAISKHRTLAPDYSVTITTGGACSQPQFNKAAWLKDMCLDCFCSNLTDVCESASGYAKSPRNKEAVTDSLDTRLVNYRSGKVLESTEFQKTIGTDKGKFIIDPVLYNSSSNPDIFLRGSFGINGSWLTSYGYSLKLNIILTGNPRGSISGPLLAIYSSTDAGNIFWCRTTVYATAAGHNNYLDIKLSSQDQWYTDPNCRTRAIRRDIMEVLVSVDTIGFRIKYFDSQTAFALDKFQLEYAEKTDNSLQWVSELEECRCPKGYTGLSCELCAADYKLSRETGECQAICNCPKCDVHGNCLSCDGNRAGPKCLQCKPETYRPPTAKLDSDCKPCDCPVNASFAESNIGRQCSHDLREEKGHLCQCSAHDFLRPDCDLCHRNKSPTTPWIPPPDSAKCDTRPPPPGSQCHKAGTASLLPNGNCLCKPEYSGENCTTCASGSFSYEAACLKCYCSGKTEKCRASQIHFFRTIAIATPLIYNFKFELARRHLDGMYVLPDSSRYLKTIDNEVIMTKSPSEQGVIHLLIHLEQPGNSRSSESPGLNIYQRLYGGLMTFTLQSLKINSTEASQLEASPIVEIDSRKFGRIWTVPEYNAAEWRYEVRLSESYWLGWRSDDSKSANLDRVGFLRALMTAKSFALAVTSSQNRLEGIRLSDVTFQIAEPVSIPEREVAIAQNLVPAPVEVCECGAESGMTGLGLSCEGCKDPQLASNVQVKPGPVDFVCGDCRGNNCTRCNSGDYNYDFVLDQTYKKCQKGLRIETESRVVTLRTGERLDLPCTLSSYRGGAAVHQWRRVATEPTNRVYESVRKPLASSAGIERSEARLQITDIQKADEGVYICEGVNMVSNVSQLFFIHVIEEAPRLVLNITIEVDPASDNKALAKGQIKPPYSLNDFHFLWTNANGSIDRVQLSLYNQSVGTFQIDIFLNTSATPTIRGDLVGLTPQKPFYQDVGSHILARNMAEADTVNVYLDQQNLTLRFMEPGRIRVIHPPGTQISSFWYKIDPNGYPSPNLPPSTEGYGGDLVIFSAAENHAGEYEVMILDKRTGKFVKRLRAGIRVLPMAADRNFTIGNKTVVDKTAQPDAQILEAYTPDPFYCPNQTWWLVDKMSNTITDITNEVKRVTKMKFQVNYNLTANSFIRFRCEAVPAAKLYGVLKFQLSSLQPQLVASPVFEDPLSPFPTRLQCIDQNKDYKSEVTVTSDKLDPSIRPVLVKNKENSAEIDWNVVGGFNPFTFAGKYVCTAKNSHTSATATIDLPNDQNPNENMTARIYIYSETNYIRKIGGGSLIRVKAGNSVKLVCVFSGYPGTMFKGWRTAVNEEKMKIFRADYWSSIAVDSFDPAVHKGVYVCIGEHRGLSLSASVNVTVSTDQESQVRFTITGLDQNRKLSVSEADNATLSCSVTNATTGEKLPAIIAWEFQNLNGEPVNVTRLASEVRTDNNSTLNFFVLTKTSGIRGTCLAYKDNMRFNSEFFYFQVEEKMIIVNLLGLNERGNVTGTEDTALAIECVGKDKKTNQVISGGQYNWQIKHEDDNLKPWRLLVINNNYIIFGSLVPQQNAKTWIKCDVAKQGTSGSSEWFSFEVIRKDDARKVPSIEIEPNFLPNASPYPVTVKCIDKISQYQSSVEWFKNDKPVPQNLIRSGPNYAELRWDHVGYFNPYEHEGMYKCTARNQYGEDYRVIHIPADVMLNETAEYSVRITSPVNEFYQGPVGRYARIVQGAPFKLRCAFYGHPPPPNGLNWVIMDTAGRQLSPDQAGHHVTYKGNYWTELSTDSFDSKSRHDGNYSCFASVRGRSISDHVLAEVYKIKMTILGTDKDGFIGGREGDNVTLRCIASDGYTGVPLPGAVYRWELRNKDSIVIPYQRVARAIVESGGNITLIGVVLNPDVTAQCIALNATSTYKSPDLRFRVRLVDDDSGEEKSDGRIRVVVTGLDQSGNLTVLHSDNANLSCMAVDTVTGQPVPDARYGWEIRRSPDSSVNLGNVAKQIDLLSSRIRLWEVKLGPRIRGRCVVNSGESRYTSKYFYINVVPKLPGDKGRVTDDRLDDGTKMTDDRIRVRVQGIDAEDKLVIKEGENTTLTCLAIDTSTWDPVPNVMFGWELLKLDDDPAQTSQLATRVTFQRDQLVINDLRSSSVSLKGRCVVVNGTVAYKSKDFRFVVISAKDGRPVDKEKVSIDDKVPATDGRIKVQVDGLDSEGRLTTTEGDNATLKCLATDAASGSPLTANVIFGWELLRADGQPTDSSRVAAVISTASDSLLLHSLRQSTGVTGRCLVYNGTALYTSQPFVFNVKDNQGKGGDDGKKSVLHHQVNLTIDGLDQGGDLSASEGEDATLMCVAADARTGEKFSNWTYGWEIRKLNGELVNTGDVSRRLHLNSTKLFLGDLKISKNIKGRCIANNGTHVYKSKYFNFNITQGGVGKIRVIVQGLDANKTVNAKEDENRNLECIAIDTKTGERISTVAYGWEVRKVNGDSVTTGALASVLKIESNKLHFNRLKPSMGVQGRCIVRNGTSVYRSPYFDIVVKRKDGVIPIPETDPGVTPTAPSDAVKVLVGGLDPDGRISAPSGTEVQLTCSAIDRSTGDPLPGAKFGWQLIKLDNDPVQSGQVATQVRIQSHLLVLTDLKPATVVKGRCVVTNGTHTFVSKDFPIKVLSPTEKPGEVPPDAVDPEKPADGRLKVFVDGLDSEGRLTANEGDSKDLQCRAMDVLTDAAPLNVTYGWEIVRNDGNVADTGRVAGSLVTAGPKIQLADLKQRPGVKCRCVARISTGDYPSAYFEFNVKDKSGVDKEQPFVDVQGDRIKVWIEGLDENGNLAAKLRADARLTCVAVDARTDLPVPGLVYGWEFKRRSGAPAHTSHLADSLTLDGDKAYFSGLMASTTAKGRCVANNGTNVYKTKYFLLDVTEGGPMKPRGVDIVVQVHGLDPKGHVKAMEGNNITLLCIAIETRTQKSATGVVFGWELKHVNDDLLVTGQIAGQTQFQKSLIKFGDLRKFPTAKGRCVVNKGGKVYTSPYFQFNITSKSETDAKQPDVTIPTADQIRVKVEGLDSQGQLTAWPRDDVTLTCKATAATTGAAVPDVTYGWEIRGLDGDPASSSLVANTVTSNRDQLVLKDLRQATQLKGRCIVRKGNYTFRSDDFKFNVVPRDGKGDPTPKRVDDGKVRVEVENLDVNGTLQAKEGDSKTLLCRAKDMETEKPLANVTYGWTVIRSDGNAMDTGRIAGSLSVTGDTMVLDSLRRAPFSVKGQCTARLGQVVYHSRYFEIVVTDGREKPNDTADVSGEKIKVEVEVLDRKGRMSAKVGDNVTLTCIAKDSQTGNTVPGVQIGWELRKSGGEAEGTSTIAQSIFMDGNKINFFFVHESNGTKGRCVVKSGVNVYRSQYFQLNIRSKDSPTEAPVGVITLQVDGLDEKGDLVENSGKNATLTCRATDSISKKEPPGVKYSWVIRDSSNQVVQRSQLADSATEEQSQLIMKSLKPSQEWVGRCRAEAEGMTYESKPFKFKVIEKSGPEKNLSALIISDVNIIRVNSQGYKYISIRKDRPLSIFCNVTGRVPPKVTWFFHTEKIETDVPIGRQKVALHEGRSLEGLTVSQVDPFSHSVFSQRYNPSSGGGYQCEASLGGKLVNDSVIIQEEPEYLKAVVDEVKYTQRSSVLADNNVTFTCVAQDLNTFQKVPVSSYHWEFRRQETDDTLINHRDLATLVVVKENQLRLERILKPSTGLSLSYKARCVAYFNTTYDVMSPFFTFLVVGRPIINSVDIIRKKPAPEVRLEDRSNYTYDARESLHLSCEANGTAGELTRTWVQCNDENCTKTTEVAQIPDLIFDANGTDRTNVGQYRCLVKLKLKDFEWTTEMHQTLFLDRIAPPAVEGSTELTITTSDELEISCTENKASPKPNVTWTFVPKKKTTPQAIPKKAKTLSDQAYILKIPFNQVTIEDSGTYICTAVNEYGSSKLEIKVTVT